MRWQWQHKWLIIKTPLMRFLKNMMMLTAKNTYRKCLIYTLILNSWINNKIQIWITKGCYKTKVLMMIKMVIKWIRIKTSVSTRWWIRINKTLSMMVEICMLMGSKMVLMAWLATMMMVNRESLRIKLNYLMSS